MPFRSAPYTPLPPDTACAARSVFNIENLYLALGDQLDLICDDLDWDSLDIKPASALFVLAMVTLFQFAEDVPDRQAVDAVRRRMDWKYALHLPADYPGFPPSELVEFRQRLAGNQAGQRVVQCLLTRLAKLGLLGSKDKRQADVGHMLATVDTLGRMEAVTEAFSLALEALAARDHEWLRAASPPHWYKRYGRWSETRALPGSREEQEAVVQATKADISYLLAAIDQTDLPHLAGLPEVQALRRTWDREFTPRPSAG